MNENKIAFIICYNNDLCMRECTRYIERLHVPGGMETDIIGIKGADGMCAGYNAAMQDSDAKYKVYLHQDVFILNVDFIEDIVGIFRENPDYGMLGMVGTDKMFDDANYWRIWDLGLARQGNAVEEEIVINSDPACLTPVVAIDGMIMVTQYDIPWREDVFDAFDFYDISQSIEFQKAGYKVGVPSQKTAWALHDCGRSNMARYEYYRERFCKEYSDLGYIYRLDAKGESNKNMAAENEILKKNTWVIEERIERGEVEEAHAIMAGWSEKCSLNNQLAVYAVVCMMIYNEKQQGVHEFFGDGTLTAQALSEKYTQYKYFLRRVELGFPLETDEFYQALSPNLVQALPALCALAPHVTLTPDATLARICVGYT